MFQFQGLQMFDIQQQRNSFPEIESISTHADDEFDDNPRQGAEIFAFSHEQAELLKRLIASRWSAVGGGVRRVVQVKYFLFLYKIEMLFAQ